MRPARVVAEVGVNNSESPAVAVDYMVSPASIGIQCTSETGSPVFTVNYTLDNVLDPEVTPTWFESDTLTGNNEVPNVLGSIEFPIRAVKVVIGSGTGSVAMSVVQFGAR